MPDFIAASVVTNKTVQQGTQAVAAAQQVTTTILPAPSAAASNSILQTVNKSVTTANTTAAAVSGIEKSIQQFSTNPAQALVAGASQLSLALKSINSTFGGSNTSLASTISTSLSGIFGNTNVKSAATPTSQISDPVTTNLLKSKPPASSPFKVDSFQAGSQTITMAGSSSTFGTGSSSMLGTQISTLLNRFNLDSFNNLAPAITNALATGNTKGLFSTLSVDAGSEVSKLAGGGILGASLGKITTAAVGTGLGIAPPNAIVNTAIAVGANDLQSFLGHSSNLSNALGSGTNLSNYYVTNPSYSLVNQSGTPVSTNKSGVDATTANAILSLLKLAGCTSSTTNYTSAHEQASLFNVSLSLAAQNGMSSEVTSLLGCAQATTPLGQTSLSTAFSVSCGTQLPIAASILNSIAAPATVKTQYNVDSILGNPTLGISNVSAVDSLMTTMGTSTLAELSVPSASSTNYPVYDTTRLSSAQPGFINGVFGDTAITDCFNGYEMTAQPDGTYTYA